MEPPCHGAGHGAGPGGRRERTVHFLLHVPKCAGTTVEAHFQTHLGRGFLIAPRWESVLRNVVGNRYPGLVPTDLTHVRVVSGHSLSAGMRRLFPDASVRESVLLRDPVSYFLSFYNYRWTRFAEGRGPAPPSFETWYRAQRRNPITRFLLSRYLEKGVPSLYGLSTAARLDFLEARLRRFHFVGSYRRADEMIAGVSQELGIAETVERQNVAQSKKLRPEGLPAKLRRRLAAENLLDQALWERWAERGWRQPAMPAPPSLPRADQPLHVVGDVATGLLKKIIR